MRHGVKPRPLEHLLSSSFLVYFTAPKIRSRIEYPLITGLNSVLKLIDRQPQRARGISGRGVGLCPRNRRL